MDWCEAESEQKQGSRAWHAWRADGIGSSECSVLMGTNKYKTVTQLYLEKTGQASSEIPSNIHMDRGNRLEPVIRQMLIDQDGVEYTPEVRACETYPFIRGSADGWDEETRTLIECKAPFKGPHDEIPPMYLAQVQWLMYIFKAERGIFASYTEGYPLKRIEVLPDLSMQAELVERAIWFWDLVRTKTPPYSSDLPALVEQYAEIKREMDALDARLTETRDAMKALVTDQGADVGGYRIQWIQRKGLIDYGRVSELQGVDLEAYRKPPSLTLDIRRAGSAR